MVSLPSKVSCCDLALFGFSAGIIFFYPRFRRASQVLDSCIFDIVQRAKRERQEQFADVQVLALENDRSWPQLGTAAVEEFEKTAAWDSVISSPHLGLINSPPGDQHTNKVGGRIDSLAFRSPRCARLYVFHGCRFRYAPSIRSSNIFALPRSLEDLPRESPRESPRTSERRVRHHSFLHMFARRL